MAGKVQQLFPHVLNAIIDSPNQETSLANIIEFIEGMSQIKNLQIDVEEVEEALRKGIDFGLIINKNNVFGITFNPFLPKDRNRRSLENRSSEENCGETCEWMNDKSFLVDSEDESEFESDFFDSYDNSESNMDAVNTRTTQYPINTRRSRAQVRKRNANGKSNRSKKS